MKFADYVKYEEIMEKSQRSILSPEPRVTRRGIFRPKKRFLAVENTKYLSKSVSNSESSSSNSLLLRKSESATSMNSFGSGII